LNESPNLLEDTNIGEDLESTKKRNCINSQKQSPYCNHTDTTLEQEPRTCKSNKIKQKKQSINKPRGFSRGKENHHSGNR